MASKALMIEVFDQHTVGISFGEDLSFEWRVFVSWSKKRMNPKSFKAELPALLSFPGLQLQDAVEWHMAGLAHSQYFG